MNEHEIAVKKVKSYRNPDKRCSYPFICAPMGYCWAYANHVDKTPKFEDMSKICPGCEFWEIERLVK